MYKILAYTLAGLISGIALNILFISSDIATIMLTGVFFIAFVIIMAYLILSIE